MIAFGQEKLEESNFTSFLAKSWKEGNVSSFKFAFGLSTFNFIIFMMYTYGLSIGGLFVYKQVSKGSMYYTSGDVISVFFGIIFGIFSMGMASPHIKALNDGRASLAEVLKVVTRKPLI